TKPEASAKDAPADAPPQPYCTQRNATLCFEFPRSPVILGWDGTENDIDGSTVIWTEAGATEPGSALFKAGPIPGSSNTQRIQLSRRTPPSATFDRMRFEIAVRLDAS